MKFTQTVKTVKRGPFALNFKHSAKIMVTSPCLCVFSNWGYTVDGRNPKQPPGMVETPKNNGIIIILGENRRILSINSFSPYLGGLMSNNL